MSPVTGAMQRLWTSFSTAEPTALLGGIFAAKSGYHNTRQANDREWPGNYSVRDLIDRLGPSDKAAAIDLTFPDAQAGDYRRIARYSRRLLDAGRRRDPRLYRGGDAVLREFYGNTDDDREVEGWDFRYHRAVTSDRTHLWHIHASVTRKFVGDWDALAGVLAILLGDQVVEDDDVLGLKINDTGRRVSALQAMMSSAGFPPAGGVDGRYGPATEAALVRLREAAGSRDPSGSLVDEWAYRSIHVMVARREAQRAGTQVMRETKTAIETALAGLPGLPGVITLDLPDQITVPVRPADEDET